MATKQPKRKRKRPRGAGGIRDIRTAVKARLRSKPEVEGQEHLDLYVLSRDRARWGRMGKQSAEIVEGIDKEMKKMGVTPPAGEDTQGKAGAPEPPRKRPEKKFGLFRLDY